LTGAKARPADPANGTREPTGTLAVALKHAQQLLESDPRLAAEQAQEILSVVPNHPQTLLILAAARRLRGDSAGALSILEPLVATNPAWAAGQFQYGLALGGMRLGDAAVAALQRAVQLQPDLAEAWLALADHLRAAGDADGADAAYARHIKAATRDPRLMAAAIALCENRIAPAEALLRDHLKQYPTDVAAIRMFAEVAARLRRYVDAENLLARCLELAPGFAPARHNYALILHRLNKPAQALRELDTLLAKEPRHPAYRNLKAAVLSRIGDYGQAVALYEEVLAEYPAQSRAWMSYGHALKTAGRQPDSIAAYRRCIELAPELGEAWWSLANLKTFRFAPDEMAAMRGQLERDDLRHEDRFHFHFALGKALEDAGDWEQAFRHYAQANELRRQALVYDARENAEHVQRSKSLFTREFFAARTGAGCTAPDPIFIVGLPRSGSTLLEQILSSHSAVEGTMELPDIISMVRALGGRKLRSDVSKYPEVLGSLQPAEFAALGEQFLRQTRIQRKTDAPYFIDKMPNNFAHLGLIHLILPNAKIVDARRHPLGCCFSGFKQHFARGQKFSYSLEDIGRYYRDYVELMAHFDAVLPGRVHRVLYESVIDDPEGEVRRLLEYCGLPFEDRCLRFYENERAVRTASSEQVRTPIFREGLDHWRHFEPWLGPLKSALGPVLDQYPQVPNF
jgi:tetratricopeptide (TPR) repeat protein